MFKRINILWIEEETQSVLAEIRSRLDNSRDFVVEIVETYVSANTILHQADIYDIIIIDIRIPQDRGANYVRESIFLSPNYEKHGIKLIKSVMERGLMKKLLIFTNESKRATLDALSVDHLHNYNFLQKTANITPEEFILYLKDIYRSNSASS